MVRNLFKRRKVTTLDDKALATQLREEAGLRQIWGSMHLQKRLEFVDESVTEVLNRLDIRRNEFKAKEKSLTLEEKQELETIDRRIEEWILYRMAKKSAIAWQAIVEDRDIGERWRNAELLFFRNEGRASHHALLKAAFSYLSDLSYKEKHVQVPSPIVIHTQIIAGSGSVNPSELIDQSRKETTNPPH
jgi:hypothetical protein